MPPKKGVKNPKMARDAKDNGRWKGGKSSDYRRKVTNAKKGEIVHHKDHNKSNNSKGNFAVIKPKKGVSAIGVHNKEHDRKNGGKAKTATKSKKK